MLSSAEPDLLLHYYIWQISIIISITCGKSAPKKQFLMANVLF